MTLRTHSYLHFAVHTSCFEAAIDCRQVPEVKVTAQALLPSTSVISFTLGNP